MRKPKIISFCTIIKNERKGVIRMLNSVNFCNEFIILDNGSTDGTKELIKKWGKGKKLILIEDKNRDDLAYLRNRTLEKATGDWIFSLDGDEELDKSCIPIVKRLTNAKEDGFSTESRIFTDTPDIMHHWNPEGWVSILWGVRLFRRVLKNGTKVFYEGKIHEMPDEVIRKNGGIFKPANIFIWHYRKPSKDDNPIKRFNIERKYNSKLPSYRNSVCHNYRLGRDYAYILKDYNKAIKHFDKCIDIQKKNHTPRNHYINFMKAIVYREQGKLGDAFTCINEAIFNCPYYSGAYYIAGLLLDEMGYYKHADEYFKKAVKLSPKHPVYKRALKELKKTQPTLWELPLLWEGLS